MESTNTQSKRVYTIFVLLSLIVFQLFAGVACKKKNDKAQITTVGARNIRTGGVNPNQFPGSGWQVQNGINGPSGQWQSGNNQLSLSGAVFSSDQNAFMQSLWGLVSVSMPPEFFSRPQDYLGRVNSQASDNTGVYVGGRVSLDQGQSFTRAASSGGQYRIAPNSTFLMAIFDEFVGQVDPASGQTIPAFPIFLSQADGSVSGNQASLVFWDGYGEISLEGNFDSAKFEGTLKYQNHRNADGSASGINGELGRFVIQTCNFFVCN